MFVGLARLRGHSAAVDEATAVFTMFAFAWLVLPIFSFGLDATLDPATLAPYPLRARPLAVGLLAGSAAGVWPLANVLGLLGVTVGLAHGAGLAVAPAAVLLQVLFCLTLARFVTTSLARLLRSRRGKDLAAFLLLPVFALYQVITQVVPRMAFEGRLRPASFAGLDRWLRWLPPGLAAHAVQDASAGRTGTALLRLAAACRCHRGARLPLDRPSCAAPWSRSTPPTSPRPCARARCRSPGSGCAAPWPPGSGSTSAASQARSSTGASSGSS